MSIALSSQDSDPYVRIAAACFLQAVADYLKYLQREARAKPSDVRDAIEAVRWLRGETTDGISLKLVSTVMDLDIRELYRAPHDAVAAQVRAHMRGRRARDH